MAIATFPNSIKPTSMRITSETQTVVSNSQNFSRQSRTRGGQRWTIKYNYPTMTRSQISPLLGFIQSQNGRAGSFSIDPASSLFSNTGDTTLGGGILMVSEDVSGTVSGGSLPLKKRINAGTAEEAFSPFSLTDKIEAGTFFKFSNHDKVYMTTQALDITHAATQRFQKASITVNDTRHSSSQLLDGDLTITMSAVVVDNAVGNANSTATYEVTISTFNTENSAEIAAKIIAAINDPSETDGILASPDADSSSKVNIEVQDLASVVDGSRKVYVQNLVSSVNVGETGIDTTVDNQEIVGGQHIATLYFDPPLRKPVEDSTSLKIAQIDSVPFNVSLKEDIWSLDIDESEHYQPFSITFEESF